MKLSIASLVTFIALFSQALAASVQPQDGVKPNSVKPDSVKPDSVKPANVKPANVEQACASFLVLYRSSNPTDKYTLGGGPHVCPR
jgi:hypothetical protein